VSTPRQQPGHGDGGPLPWTYWPIVTAAFVFSSLVGGAIGATIGDGANPYVTAAVLGVLYAVCEALSAIGQCSRRDALRYLRDLFFGATRYEP
jgi:hypothetical protein